VSAVLPFIADGAAPLGQPIKTEAAVSAAGTVQFGAALEQALLAAATSSLPHPPQDNAPLIDLAAALTEFAVFDMPDTEAAPAAAVQTKAPIAPESDLLPATRLPVAALLLPLVPLPAPRLPVAALLLPIVPLPVGAEVPAAAALVIDAPQAPTAAALIRNPSADVVSPARVAMPELLERANAPATPAPRPAEAGKTEKTDAPADVRGSSTGTESRVARDTNGGDDVKAPEAVVVRPPTERDQTNEPDHAHAPEVITVERTTPAATGENASQNPMLAEMVALMAQAAPRVYIAPQPAAPHSATRHAHDGAEVSAASADQPTGPRAATAVGDATQRSAPVKPAQRLETEAPLAPTPLDALASAAPVEVASAAGSSQLAEAAAPAAGVGFTLPAGLHVLALHTQHARRQVMTRHDKSSPSDVAPRTSAVAAAELGAATEMPTVAADAIEQLRRPVPPTKGVALPSEWRGHLDASARNGTPVERASATPSDLQREDDVVVRAMPAPVSGIAERIEHASAQPVQGRDVGPARVETVLTSSGTAAPLAAPTATAPAEPAEQLRLKHGVERISVRLGDEAGDPVVRISIRGDTVDARISTTDQGLARALGAHTRELSAALEAKGFEQAKVQVRGTGSANESMSPAQVAGSSVTELRDAKRSGSEDSRHSPDERAQAWKDDRPDQRRQRPPRRLRLEDDEQP
jgi:hypothetical protein